MNQESKKEEINEGPSKNSTALGLSLVRGIRIDPWAPFIISAFAAASLLSLFVALTIEGSTMIWMATIFLMVATFMQLLSVVTRKKHNIKAMKDSQDRVYHVLKNHYGLTVSNKTVLLNEAGTDINRNFITTTDASGEVIPITMILQSGGADLRVFRGGALELPKIS